MDKIYPTRMILRLSKFITIYRGERGEGKRWGQGERAAASPLPATCVNMWGSGGGGRLPFCLLVLSDGDNGGVPGCGGMGEQGMGGEGGGRASL